MDEERLLIWWTTGADCREIGSPNDDDDLDYPRGAPAYIQREYLSRVGRNGRGRLWIPKGINPQGIPWDDSKPAAKEIAARSHAGIVFWVDDLSHVVGLPGFITDLNLDAIPNA